MSEYTDFYKQFTDLTEQQRMNLCQNAIAELMEDFEKRGLLKHEDFAISFFTSLIGFFIGADEKVTRSEAAIFNEIFSTHYSPEELAKFLPNLMTADNYIALDEFIDGMDQRQKQLACYVILGVISADGEVTEREAALFQRILA